LEEVSRAYNVPGVYQFEGQLDAGALEQAFQALIGRHEVLRTVFRQDDQGEVYQYVLGAGQVPFSLTEDDLRHFPDQQEVKARIEEHLGRPFDLSAGPLLRAQLYRVEDQQWVFSYVMHHIISDGWSMGILIRELLTLYQAALKGEQAELPALAIHYKDYAYWQQGQLQGAALDPHKAYWLEQFSGEIPVIEWPVHTKRPPVKTYRGKAISRNMNPALSAGLKALVQQQETTLFMGLLATVQVLLQQYTGQHDIIVGSPVAGREHNDVKDQIGCYINSVALRTRVEREAPFQHLLQKVKESVLLAFEHQAYPFDELIDQLPLKRDLGRNTLFDVWVVLNNAEFDLAERIGEQGISGLHISPYAGDESLLTKFDLLFRFTQTRESIQLTLEYNTDILSEKIATEIATRFDAIVGYVLQEPEIKISEINGRLAGSAKEKQKEYARDLRMKNLQNLQVHKPVAGNA
jgi:non-ribosomal peptide synthetase component F